LTSSKKRSTLLRADTWGHWESVLDPRFWFNWTFQIAFAVFHHLFGKYAPKMNIIETNDLDFHYREHKALSNLNLAVPEKTIYGFLGPNGAGKSTTIRALLGLIPVGSDKVRLFGKDINRHRLEILRKTGSIIETPSSYEHLSGYKNLEIFQKILGLKKRRIEEVLEVVSLSADGGRKVNEYSLGMKQRLGIGYALISDPELLILDEPLNGLDPGGIREVRALLITLNREAGKTIFISSHVLSEVEKTCKVIGILNKGKLIFQGQIAELSLELNEILIIKTDNNVLAMEGIARLNFKSAVSEDKLEIRINSKEDVRLIVKNLVENNIAIEYLNSANNTLEDKFLTMISQSG